ncbi:MAG TPA: alkaline phosphatase family protein [Terriglobales bacterium]|nr:alkaline phosphatase family protein [Terriglobales bacterium]
MLSLSRFPFLISLFVVFMAGMGLQGQDSAGQNAPKSKPHVVVVGVNGMEWDIIRPLLMRGELPNLASVIKRGVYGKLRTVPAPNCPKVYSTIATSTPPEQNGVTGFIVGGITANTNMLKEEPLWSVLSKHGVTVGMANVPATFPVMPVNGYMVSGMLTRGKGCEDGVLCSPKLSEVQGGDAVYPKSMVSEIEKNVGDISIDCARMPSADDLKGHETQLINEWLDNVQRIRAQQTKLFDYLLTNHPTDYTMMVQSCEDRVGHWLYPIQPHNVGYNPKISSVKLDAFPNQYREFDKVLGTILKHVDDNTYLFILSDHGIKPLREFEEDPHMHMDHGGTTPVIAKHDFADGDDVPGSFIAMGPDIKHDVRLMGFQATVFDVAPTILRLYGISAPGQMKGRVLTEIFENRKTEQAAGNGQN